MALGKSYVHRNRGGFATVTPFRVPTNKRIKNVAKKVAKNAIARNSELKHYGGLQNALSLGGSGSTAVPKFNTIMTTAGPNKNFTSSALVALDPINQGTGSAQRIGDRIRVKRVKLHAQIYNSDDKPTAEESFRCRYIVVALKRGFPNTPTDIFNPSFGQSNYFDASIKKEAVQKVIVDRKVILNNENSFHRNISSVKKWDKTITYQDSSAQTLISFAHYLLCEDKNGISEDFIRVSPLLLFDYTDN